VLRRLRFPLNGALESDHDVDLAARTTLTALGLAAGTLARSDMDLRSRCHLFATGESSWQLLDHPHTRSEKFELDPDAALRLLAEAIADARRAGLPWEQEPVELTPSTDLIELVRRSQVLDSTTGAEEA